MTETLKALARAIGRRALPAILAACAAALASCNSGVITPGEEESVAPSSHTIIAFDPGIALTGIEAGIIDTGAAGAQIPGGPDEQPLEVVLFAFSTAVAANAENNQGTALVSGALDENEAPDVFLAALLNTSDTTSGAQIATTFKQALAPTFRSPRCVTCHGARESPSTLNRDAHRADFMAASGCDSQGCHVTSILPEGKDREWNAPEGLDFRGKSDQELCDMVLDPELFPTRAEALEHLKEDAKLIWALTSGKVPDGGPSNGKKELSGMTHERWVELVDLWATGGFECDDSSAVRAVDLVSRTRAGRTTAGDAGSSEPAVAFRPDPGFKPSEASAAAGTVFVAFSSTAGNLLEGNPAHRNAYLAAFRLIVTRGADGRRDVGIEFERLDLLSAPTSGSLAGGNGDSGSPSLSGDGRKAAFESRATDLVGGFMDSNGAGAPDVFLREIASSSTLLVSRSLASPVEGGNAASTGPALSFEGDAIAFESRAADLVADDTNEFQDIFYALLGNAATGEIRRASLTRNGGEAHGGDCRGPSIHVADPAVEGVLVAFESDKTDLARPPAPRARTNVYVHDSRPGGQTLLLSQNAGAAGNGDSRRPQMGEDGRVVVFETDASNLDQVRPRDGNKQSDIVLARIAGTPGKKRVSLERLSIASNGSDGDGPSAAALAGSFRRGEASCGEEMFVAYTTQAGNLGKSASTDSVLVFLGGESAGAPTAPALSCNLAASSTNTGIGESITFQVSGAEGGVRFDWDFGDGESTVTTDPQTTHGFNAPGVFEVSVKFRDASGACSSCGIQVTVVNRPPECRLKLSVSGAEVAIGANVFRNQELTFSATESADPDPGDAIVSHAWDFGDGTSGAGPSTTHTYVAAGEFTASLTVVDGFGGSSSCSRQVRVVVPVNNPPACNLTANRTRIFTGESITFTANASDADNDPLTYEWNFGDGSPAVTGSLDSISHTFATFGESLNVSVKVTDNPQFNLAPLNRTCVLSIVVGARFTTVAAQLQGCNVAPGCHRTSPSPLFSGNNASIFTELKVGQRVWCNNTQIMVVPFQPASSWLVTKMEFSMATLLVCGRGMGGTADQIRAIRSWIAAGASNN
ncbi:MAG TPA: PKD domain-containing protein [Planctomycetota bacterium]|nr:PKD domain-containing protein [Planctomycetota bacterium]